MTTQKNLYEQDFYAWCFSQAEAIRDNRFVDVDILNLAEEIESVGRGEKRELKNLLALLFMHLLKCIYQEERLSSSWIGTICRMRDQIKDLLKENPSLKPEFEPIAQRAYATARWDACQETGISSKVFPIDMPFTIEQALDDKWMPE
jgi:hypothetical protein